MSGIIHVLKTGCRWQDCPSEYGPYATVSNRFNRWNGREIWHQIFETVAGSPQGQTILIENRAGAGGAIGAEAASHAAPDRSTLVLASTDIIIPSHLRQLNYDLLTGFDPICHLVSAPSAIVVNTASPYRTLDDLLNAARAKPGDLTAASAGQTALQIAIETLKRAAKVEMTSSRIWAPLPRLTDCWVAT